ncbi:hypothetical protein [Lacibacter sp. H407]|uniref:hypothetical protein n=1 Tax=Lacibacter sp. H407 TaxID=3133423 RepID=UPI0030BA9EA8
MLQWYFGPSGSEEHGPKDSITQTFKGDKYYSLAREVIQNSLDAVVDKSQPVKVKFSLFTILKQDLPQLFDVSKRYQMCSDYYSADKPFVNFCNTAQDILSKEAITCLRISDYNTTGLEYSPDDTRCKFYAFMDAVGVTNKASAGAGGSFGFGKGAYYAASPLRIITVSSIYDSDKFIFRGKARLTTHKDESGKKSDYTGLFGFENGKAIDNPDLLPDLFRRNETGTDIIIIGFKSDEHVWKTSLIKSILNNFWLSIWEEHLVADVDGITIDKSNLEQVMLEYYSDELPDGSVNEPENWNPYPYFKAIKFKEDSRFTKYFEDELPTIGKVRLAVFLKDNYPNRIMYMRSPKMVVFKKTDNRGFNYAGVFVCDNEKGNEILRQMENPQHNEWKKNNYLDNERPHTEAALAENELKSFVKKCLETLMTADTGKKQRIIGLDRYLNIPEDLLEENETGDGDAVGGLNISEEATIEETAIENTLNESEEPIKLAIRNQNISRNTQGNVNPEGDDNVFTGTIGINTDSQGGEPALAPGLLPGQSTARGNESGLEKIKIVLPVKTRVIATKTADGRFEHIIRIFSSKNANAELQLHAGVDNDSEKDDMLTISEAAHDTDILKVDANKIKHVALKAGWNELKVKFDSNQKHSLKLKSYEI